MPLNDSNFLMWFPIAEGVFANVLPRPFVRESEVLSPVVWLVNGEVYSYYINTLGNVSLPEPLTLVHENGQSINLQVGDPLSISFPGGAHRYGSFTTPSNLPDGLVYLKIDIFRTQYLWLTTASKATDKTAIVRFRNNQRLMNFRYGYLPEDFYQVFRVRMALRGEEPEINKATYRTGTTGKTRHLYSEPRMLETIITPEYDKWGHRAIVALMEHDELFINTKPYAFVTAYKSNMNEGDVLSTGEFTVSDEDYATLHRT
jgi:hypothetical protein